MCNHLLSPEAHLAMYRTDLGGLREKGKNALAVGVVLADLKGGKTWRWLATHSGPFRVLGTTVTRLN